MKNKKIFALLFVFLLAFPLGVFSSDFFLKSAPADKVQIQGGVIRLNESGPEIYSNQTHINLGLKEVHRNGDGNLVIIRELQDASFVSVNVMMDETLASKGVTCGVSGGGYQTIVYFYRYGQRINLNDPIQYNDIAGKYSNIFFTYTSVSNSLLAPSARTTTEVK